MGELKASGPGKKRVFLSCFGIVYRPDKTLCSDSLLDFSSGSWSGWSWGCAWDSSSGCSSGSCSGSSWGWSSGKHLATELLHDNTHQKKKKKGKQIFAITVPPPSPQFSAGFSRLLKNEKPGVLVFIASFSAKKRFHFSTAG